MSIKNGDTISVHYVGTFEDGEEFDRSTPDSPLSFKVGSGQVIEGFDKAVLGKAKGDSFTIVIPAVEAYGDHDEELVFEVERAQLPETIQPEIGLLLHVETDQGELEVAIIDVDEDTVVLDANHPMAGENLVFQITIDNINS